MHTSAIPAGEIGKQLGIGWQGSADAGTWRAGSGATPTVPETDQAGLLAGGAGPGPAIALPVLAVTIQAVAHFVPARRAR
jgi:hypothetical protein